MNGRIRHATARPKAFQDRALAWEIVGAGQRVGRFSGVVTPGERQVGGGTVVEVVVRDAPDDRVAVGEPRQTWQVLPEKRARNGAGDGTELASNFERSVGFGIPRFELTLTPIGVDEDHRSGSSESRESRVRAQGLGRGPGENRQPAQAGQGADPKPEAPRHGSARSSLVGEKADHRRGISRRKNATDRFYRTTGTHDKNGVPCSDPQTTRSGRRIERRGGVSSRRGQRGWTMAGSRRCGSLRPEATPVILTHGHFSSTIPFSAGSQRGRT